MKTAYTFKTTDGLNRSYNAVLYVKVSDTITDEIYVGIITREDDGTWSFLNRFGFSRNLNGTIDTYPTRLLAAEAAATHSEIHSR